MNKKIEFIDIIEITLDIIMLIGVIFNFVDKTEMILYLLAMIISKSLDV